MPTDEPPPDVILYGCRPPKAEDGPPSIDAPSKPPSTPEEVEELSALDLHVGVAAKRRLRQPNCRLPEEELRRLWDQCKKPLTGFEVTEDKPPTGEETQ